MAKWKCGICGLEFENFHAQGFNGVIYCPLCYFKEEYKLQKDKIDRLNCAMNKVKVDLKNTKKINNHFKDKWGNEFVNIDIDHIDYLINILKENER